MKDNNQIGTRRQSTRLLQKQRLQEQQKQQREKRRKRDISRSSHGDKHNKEHEAHFRPIPGCTNHNENDCGILPSE